MKNTFAVPVAGTALAVMLLAACSDDGPTTLARGEVEFVGSGPLTDQRLAITAEEEDGEVSGEARFNEIAVNLQCADTETDGMVVLGGEQTAPASDPAVGGLMAIIVFEGEPDSVAAWADEGGSDSCEEMLDALPADIADDATRADVADGDDIETS